MNWKLPALGAATLFCLIVFWMTTGVNYNGYRTVVQTPSGYTYVKFTPGFYFQMFGTTETYPDYITFDFDKTTADDEAKSINQLGIPVRYNDGGTGTIFGQGRYILPADEKTMLELHRAFRSANGLAFKLVKPTTEEKVNLTAGLMSSEEAYVSKRGTFTEWARDQAEYKQEQTLRGEGDASYKKAVIEADGALAQKLKTYESVMTVAFRELGRNKLVPEIVMGGSPSVPGSQATNLLDLLTTKAAKDLSLDLSVSGTRAVKP